MSTQSEKHATGLAGEYLVAGMLSLQGYVASLTLKNYPAVDIFALDPKKEIFRHLQVKASRGKDILIGGSHSKIDTLYERYKYTVVFVKIDKDNSVSYYIVPAKDLVHIIKKVDDVYIQKKKDKSIDYPMAIKFIDIEKYRDKWELIWE